MKLRDISIGWRLGAGFAALLLVFMASLLASTALGGMARRDFAATVHDWSARQDLADAMLAAELVARHQPQRAAQAARDFAAARAAYGQLAAPAGAGDRAGEPGAAGRSWQAGEAALLARIDAGGAGREAALRELARRQGALFERARAGWIALGDSVIGTMLGLMAGMALAAWLLLRSVRRGIVQPLVQAAGVARQLAGGQLHATLQVHGRDEVGQLQQAIRDMGAALGGMVGQVRQSAEAMATASREIAAGNADLAARTAQQAAALNGTTAALGELSEAAQRVAGLAREADGLLQSTSGQALRSGQVVAEVAQRMAGIKSSAAKVAEISAAIDGIAFQTGILALNAAVEAARAGDKGRGFAVVADEVRALAQRAATAAQDIKRLIAASSGQIGSGEQQVAAAGRTMAGVVDGVRRAAALAAGMAAESARQETGIGEVHGALRQLDGITRQNGALVEQAAAAAQEVGQEAQQLAQAVQHFALAPAPLAAARRALSAAAGRGSLPRIPASA